MQAVGCGFDVDAQIKAWNERLIVTGMVCIVYIWFCWQVLFPCEMRQG